jgi:hypothetical protein
MYYGKNPSKILLAYLFGFSILRFVLQEDSSILLQGILIVGMIYVVCILLHFFSFRL